MEKKDLDAFLDDAFDDAANPFEVEDLFDGARSAASWPMMQRVLKLDNVKGRVGVMLMGI